MNHSDGKGRRVRHWIGIVLLSISGLWWAFIVLLIVVDFELQWAGTLALMGFSLSAIPIGIGVYLVTRGEKAPKESWFGRHLNVTLVLSWIVALSVWFTFGSDFWFDWGDVTVQWTPAIKAEVFGDWVEAIKFLGTPVIVLVGTVWYLIKKNRSLLHLLWYLFFPPIGAIILLSLKYKGEVVDIVGGKLVTKPRRETD